MLYEVIRLLSIYMYGVPLERIPGCCFCFIFGDGKSNSPRRTPPDWGGGRTKARVSSFCPVIPVLSCPVQPVLCPKNNPPNAGLAERRAAESAWAAAGANGKRRMAPGLAWPGLAWPCLSRHWHSLSLSGLRTHFVHHPFCFFVFLSCNCRLASWRLPG